MNCQAGISGIGTEVKTITIPEFETFEQFDEWYTERMIEILDYHHLQNGAQS